MSNSPDTPVVKKKRGAVFIVIVVSVAVHLLAGGVLAIIKITEVLQKEPEFEAPPLEAVEPPPPPPPPPPTTQRTQKSMPRPQPLAAQNPQNMDVPAIEIDRSNLNMLSGRGFGGGLGDIGGGVMDSFTKINFFGMESSGGNVAILFDSTWSGAGVFDQTSEELIKTIKQVDKAQGANLAVIYYGGKSGGHGGASKNPEKAVKSDFWYPRGVKDGYLSAGDPALKKIIRRLEEVQENVGKARVKDWAEYEKNEDAFFLLGTNYWGAFYEAFNLKPPPDTIYMIVEPKIAFNSVGKVESRAIPVWEEAGRRKPANTKLIFVVGGKVTEGDNLYQASARMLNYLSGDNLSDKEIREQIIIPDPPKKK